MTITRERFRELQETGVLSAWLKGEEWQWRDKDMATVVWHTADNLNCPLNYGESTVFRLKPKPLELWVPEFEGGGFGYPQTEKPNATFASSLNGIRPVAYWHKMRGVEK